VQTPEEYDVIVTRLSTATSSRDLARSGLVGGWRARRETSATDAELSSRRTERPEGAGKDRLIIGEWILRDLLMHGYLARRSAERLERAIAAVILGGEAGHLRHEGRSKTTRRPSAAAAADAITESIRRTGGARGSRPDPRDRGRAGTGPFRFAGGDRNTCRRVGRGAPPAEGTAATAGASSWAVKPPPATCRLSVEDTLQETSGMNGGRESESGRSGEGPQDRDPRRGRSSWTTRQGRRWADLVRDGRGRTRSRGRERRARKPRFARRRRIRRRGSPSPGGPGEEPPLEAELRLIAGRRAW